MKFSRRFVDSSNTECSAWECCVLRPLRLYWTSISDSHGGGEISSSVPFHRKREEVAVDKYMVLKCSGSQYPIFVKIYDNGALGDSNVIGS